MVSSFTESHRNGVTGLGFYVGIAEGALCVEFSDNKKIHRVSVSLDILHEIEVGEHERLSCLTDCNGSAWLMNADEETNTRLKAEGTFVALHAPYAPERATAVLKVDILPDVRFGYNSWRGDYWDTIVRGWHMAEELHDNDEKIKLVMRELMDL